MSEMSKVIEGWTFLEMITPGEVPSLTIDIKKDFIKGDKRFKSVVPISQSTKLINELKLANPAKKLKRYTYYMNTYTKHELIVLLRDYFKNKEEIINKSRELYYSFSFDVNDKGEYIEDSLFIPHLQLIVDDIQRNGKISYHDFTDRYTEKKTKFEEELRVIFQNSIRAEELKKVEKLFVTYFNSINYDTGRSYVQCSIFNKTAQLNSNQFNSFFLNDLQTILKKGKNNTLSHFINGTPMQINVNENREAIEEMLSLKNMPLGRWPSPVNHRLSLMQQVAVNHILQGNEPISSVNGPPGTGKTTLLKDVFAQLIVERASQMVTYDDPTKAFTKVGKQEIEMSEKVYSYNMHELDPNIAKYSMVVASCNNGAVENISKELPLLEEVVRHKKPDKEEREEEMAKSGIDPIVFYEYDCAYAEEAEKLDFFKTYAEKLLVDEQAWGMFSGAFGRQKNIQSISNSLQSKQGDHIPLLDYLKQPVGEKAWQNAVKEFNDLRNEIESDRGELVEFIETMQQAESITDEMNQLSLQIAENEDHQIDLEQTLNSLEEKSEYLKERLYNLPKPSFFVKMIQALTGKRNQEEMDIRQQRDEVLNRLISQSKEKDKCVKEIHQLRKRVEILEEKLKKIECQKVCYQNQQVVLSTDDFWDPSFYNERQKAVLWQTHELNFKRGLLFLKALQVHKVFLHKNHHNLKVSITMLQNLRSINLNIDENKRNVGRMWKTLHLIFPVMSTTFASLGSMYRGVGKDFIDYLFVDEAGQASPQQAAGGLWRAKRAIIVGDPIQIEPVVTLDETILSDIRKSFKLSEYHIGSTASVQTMADHANPIGTYKGEGENKERIGIPLWVHRRCKEPMFSIANEIAYENKMVLAINKTGDGHWFNVDGKVQRAQYVKEHGEFIVKEIERYFIELKEGATPSIFVITPFTAVKSELIRLINKKLGGKIEGIRKWANSSIGTVHTFQGKEADIVYFVTGTDVSTESAANWSCMKPNLLNVAVTRAKDSFFVVGDLSRFKTKQYYNVITQKIDFFQRQTEQSSISE